MIQSSPLLSGPSDLLVLLVLRRSRLHRWGIAQRLQQLSRDVVQLDDASVSVSLRRMQERGWVDVELQPSELSDPIHVYRLTRLGRQQFKRFKAEYTRVTAAIARLIERA